MWWKPLLGILKLIIGNPIIVFVCWQMWTKMMINS